MILTPNIFQSPNPVFFTGKDPKHRNENDTLSKNESILHIGLHVHVGRCVESIVIIVLDLPNLGICCIIKYLDCVFFMGLGL